MIFKDLSKTWDLTQDILLGIKLPAIQWFCILWRNKWINNPPKLPETCLFHGKKNGGGGHKIVKAWIQNLDFILHASRMWKTTGFKSMPTNHLLDKKNLCLMKKKKQAYFL